jgi:hypothetical protein
MKLTIIDKITTFLKEFWIIILLSSILVPCSILTLYINHNNAIDAIRERVAYQDSIHVLKNKNDSLTLVVDTLSYTCGQNNLLCSVSEFEINFKSINAFSIERAIKEKVLVTLIGYKDINGNVQVWFFRCSEETHKRLVKQFKKEILEQQNNLGD